MAKSIKQSRFTLPFRNSSFHRKVVTWIMLLVYMAQPILVSAQAIADSKAPTTNTPTVGTTASGIPIVQIAKPSVSGISHNIYQQFNVDPSGLIFNNSQVLTGTQLAGYITGNPNLVNGSAKIILNEVSGINPSYLNGYMEVAGQKAEVIIANPNGIYGNGFGFINASRAVLTTGTPIFGGTGSLDAFRVTGGQISIQGTGMNSAGVDQVDLISRSLNINTGVWAKKLNVVAGSNKVDYNTLHTETISGDANIPQVAIDIGQLGGMYAQKIYLVGTENGVGVNSKGTIAAQAGDITITSAGKVLLAGNTSANGNIQITAVDDVNNENTLYAQGNANITTQTALKNNGTIAAGQHTVLNAQNITSTGALGAGIKMDGTVGDNFGDLIINSTGAISVRGENIAAGNLVANGATLDLVNSKNNVGGNASLTSTNGDIDHRGGTLHVDGALNTNAYGGFLNDNGNINSGKITLNANFISNRSGTLFQVGQETTKITAVNSVNNTSGTVSSNGNSLIIQADSLINSQGEIQHAGNSTLSVETINDIENDNGKLLTNGQVQFIGKHIDNSQGTIMARGIDLTAQSLVNITGKILSQDTIKTDIVQSIDNSSGTITAKKNIFLGKTSTSIVNEAQGNITTGENLVVQATILSNTGGTMAANTDVTVIADAINGTGTVTAGQNVNITVNGDVTNSADSNVKANRDLNLSAKDIINLGNISAINNLTINAKNVTNGDNAKLQGGNELRVTVTDHINNNGNMEGNTALISAENITNIGSVFGENVNMKANIISNNGSKAVIAATEDINLYAKTLLENKDDASIYSMGNINIAGSDEQGLNGEYINRTDSVLNESATIEADGNIDIYAGTLTNKIQEYETKETVVSQKNYDQVGVLETWYNGDYLYAIRTPMFNYGLEPTTAILLAGATSNWRSSNSNAHLWLLKETVTETTVIPKSSIGKIMSANNMNLRTDIINNNMGWVIANGTLSTTGSVNNTALGNTRNTIRKMVYATDYFWHYDKGTSTAGNYYNFPIYEYRHISVDIGRSHNQTTSEQIPGGSSSIFGGGKQVLINGGNINNTTIVTTTVPSNDMQTLLPSSKIPDVIKNNQTVVDNEILLPTNGMFSMQQEPTSKYLVETNPRFANYKNFISSDYVLQQIGLDPAKITKRLGDGFYEQKLVREQITELTGRYFLNGYSSAEAQYTALMDNGATYAKQFDLQIGVALSNEQMSQLTSDMVWMVEKEIDGQKVLVPEVYLSSASNIDLKPNGAIIVADNIKITNSGDVKNAGVIKATESVDIQAVNIANYGGTIDGGNSTIVDAKQDLANIGGKINGETISLTAGNNLKNETITFTNSLPFLTKTTAGNIASINAGNNLTVTAHDISINGAEINAQQDVIINAKGNFTVDSIKERDRLQVGSYLKDDVSNVVSSISAGNNVSITSTADTILKGAQIMAGSKLDITAGGNINITAVKDEAIKDETVGSSSNWIRTRTDNETVIGTNLLSFGEITIKAEKPLGQIEKTDSENRGNITITSSVISVIDRSTPLDGAAAAKRRVDTLPLTDDSEVKSIVIDDDKVTSSNRSITISADKNLTIQEATEKHESLVQTHKKSSGFLSSKTTDTMDHSLINEVKGSTISSDTVTLTSGNDLTLQASNVVGTNDVILTVDNNVNIISADEMGVSEHYSYTKKSGIFSGGGLGFTIGSQSKKTTTNEQILDQVGSTIGSLEGNVSITAGNEVNSTGTTLIAAKDINITGKAVSIENTVDTYDSQTKYEFKQTGLSVSLGGGIVDTATNAYNNIERSGEVQDERLKALYEYKAYKDLKDIKNTLDDGLTKNNLENGVSINVSIGSTKITSTDTVHAETINTSNINAGGDVNITATAGDLNLTGTQTHGEDITLDAKKNINIKSAEEKLQTTNSTSSSSWSLGGSFGLSTGAFGGFSGNFNSSKGNENENSITNVGSIIDASETLTLKSGENANITGSQVKGDKVVADIGGDLNIASLQDTDDYTAKNQSSGVGFSTGAKSGVTGSVSKGNTDSTYASVTEQAGIFAEEKGFDITVGKNTDLKGAVISSEATPDKNKLSTDTLTYSDIQNHAEYDSSSIGVNYNSNLKPGMILGDLGLTPNPGITVSDDASSTTKSAISSGTIEVRSNPNQDLSKLSRDTTNSLNALGTIFDKQTVQERQELAGLFSQIANEEIHKLGLKDGDPLKVILHTVAGTITGDMGGDAFSGGFSAGLNEALQGELAKITDPAMRQWASFIIGEVASKVAGGTPLTGGTTAVNGTKYNELGYEVTAVAYIGGIQIALLEGGKMLVAGVAYAAGSAVYEWAYDKYINATFPESPYDFNPDGLVRKEWDTGNGKVVKWINPDTRKSEYEWNEDFKNGEHYHKTPDGKGREKHPDTGDTHMKPGDTVPE